MNVRSNAISITVDISGYNCDIICLQEVDQKVMQYDLQPVLDMFGYEGFLKVKRKTSSQGLATFWQRDRFQ